MKQKLATSILLCTISCISFAEPTKKHDPSKDKELAAIINTLNIEQKIDLLCADAPAIDSLKLPKYDWWSECLHGVARNGKATVFPKPIGLGSMWDPELVKQIANAISDEARAKYNVAIQKQGYSKRYEGLTFFSPTLNLARDPRWGRTSECFSEDPYLTGEVGTAFIQGLQGEDPEYLKIAATSKHFVANNEENRRNDGSANVDEVSLREYYLPAFEKSVKKGHVASVMSAYNALNGVPCSANSFLLNNILRDEWGFNGVVISDGSAVAKIFTHHKYVASSVQAATMALKSGCDMSLRDEYREGLRDAYKQQLVSVEDINQAVMRVLALRKRLGVLENDSNIYSQIPESVIECEAHRELALEAARRSIILLKNDDSILPIDTRQYKKIALIGEAFKSNYYGDYSGIPEHSSVLMDELYKYTSGCNVRWVSDKRGIRVIPAENFKRDEKYADEGLVGLTGDYYNNDDLSGTPFLTRNDHNIDFVLEKDAVIKAKEEVARSVRWISSLIPNQSGEHTLVVEADAVLSIYLNDVQIASGQGASKQPLKVKVDLVEGQSYPIRIETKNMRHKTPITLSWAEPLADKELTPSLLAKASDLAIIFLRDDAAAEGSDRKTLNVQIEQMQLVREVTSANPNTIVIFGSSTPMLIKEIAERCKSLLNSWISGQGEATALAEILFGKTNPSGKTPVTFIVNEQELPPLDSYDVKKGRSYQYFKGEVLYPFGFGLSYSTFAYQTPVIHSINTDGMIEISTIVTNTGEYDGEEVIQCYVSNKNWEKEGLEKKLVAFKRVFLLKGESKNISLSISRSDYARWDINEHTWSVSEGQYTFYIQGHSALSNGVITKVKDTMKYSD